MEKLKRINSFVKKIQIKLKDKVSKLEINNINLKQSNFFIRTLTWGLLSVSGLTISWLAFAYTEEIVIVKGKLEPIGDVKIINIPSGGVVKDILVSDGEEVSKGQILLVLDDEILKENVNSLKNQLNQVKVELELKKEEKIKLNELYRSKLKFLNNEFELQDEIKNKFKELFDEGALSEIAYLKKISDINSLEGEIVENEINLKRQSLILSQQIKQIESEVSELEAKGLEAEVLLGYKSIKSPVNGMVFDMRPRNIGFVAQSNFSIMKIVPFNKLEADVKIPSSKIGFIKIGMPVDISIDSFPANDFAPLEGIVDSIGSDVLDLNEKNNQEYFFPGSIKLNSQSLILNNGNELPLQVGMSLKANIKLRKVSYLKLLLGSFRDKAESIKSI
ncbi:HlyD family secretion protein [Prochlorococcus marinus]|uniref:Putative transporter component n=1 Tax=Prochlorococcus marinus str. GP2 TaxID=59925 RepID=A0A0A1ZE69_PROMR|nr:HlyD family efflux transporter periplasmic adaptor subunit [Prochlorococcus marinus]KGF86469.1 putative transporter component [Prochlorococcus marinus str. GP2]